MKNNNVTNPPEIKRNLFKLTKKCKNDINKLIPFNNNKYELNKQPKFRNKHNSKEKQQNNYKLNSFLSESTPLQNIINQINIENNFITNINYGKDSLLLSDRTNKNNINNITNKNVNKTINLNKSVADIIKRRISQKEIQKIKNKVKHINKTKKSQLLNSKTITLKDFKKTCLNNNNNNINNKIDNKKKKKKEKLNDKTELNYIKKNKKENEEEDLNYLGEEKINKKYFETRRLSIDWGNTNNNDIEKLTDRIINQEKNNIDKQISNISKLNLSFDDNDNKSNIKTNKKLTKLNSLKNVNYDYDSFIEDESKSQKNININLINSNNNSNHKSETIKNRRNNDNNNFSIISISNFEDNKKNIKKKEIKEIDDNKNDIEVNINKNNQEINNEKTNSDKNKDKEEIIIEKNNNNDINKDISKIDKDKLEIENIQKIISNTVESLNINLNNQPPNNQENYNSKISCQKNSVLNRNESLLKVNQNKENNNIINSYGRITYSKKIITSQTKYNNLSCHKPKNNTERVLNKNNNEINELNISQEGIKYFKIKNQMVNDNNINNNINNKNNSLNKSFIKPLSSNNFFALNNCCYNLNNNTNNIFYEITNPTIDFLLRINNNKDIINKCKMLKINNNYVKENISNNREKNLNNKINGNLNNNILSSLNFEDFIILDNKLNDIKQSLSSIKKSFNESFEYLNFFYNCSINQDNESFLKDLTEGNFIKICFVYILLSIIVCYDCSINDNIFEQTHLLLKEIIELNHKNAILLYEYLLEKMSSLSGINIQNKVWISKIQDLINAFKNLEHKNELNELLSFDDTEKETSLIEKIKSNTNFIINNINIILSNIKSKNHLILITLFKSINTISFKDIFHNFFSNILYIPNYESSIIGQALINSKLFLGNINNNNNIILPYIKTKNLKKYSLVIDLEETLLHFKKDINNINEGLIDIRPGTIKFLDDISEFYELIIFNEGEKKYTDLLIDSLEENKIYFEHRLYREHIIIDNNDIVKDLIRIGRDLDKILIVDNMKQNFKLQKDNGILIKSFYGEDDINHMNDNVLEELANILINIAKDGGDIRKGIIKYKNQIVKKVTLGNNNNF